MITLSAHDGEIFDEKIMNENGFFINSNRDIRRIEISNPVTGEKTGESRTVYNFVGFVSNENNDLLVVFPKHFKINNIEVDSNLIFRCIAKHIQTKPELYIGDDGNKTFESNYPFAAFFEVYNYYNNYGLHTEEKFFIKPNTGGRISWKATIGRGNKCLMGNNVILFPMYYRKNYKFTSFITECMIYVIDYTINRFGTFIDLDDTGKEFPELNMIEEREYVILILESLRQQVFRDSEQILIDSLINFFGKFNVGGDFYLKHYAFSSIWEDMVTNYLCSYYKEINSKNEIVFDKLSPSKISFEKKSFHTNAAKKAQYISPDHYGADCSNQLIFDAKYYMNLSGIDYKQVAYVFMLREMRDSLTLPQKYAKTYSALILPSEKRKTKIHFKMEPIFGKSSSDVIITEEYIDIVDVMKTYNN